MTDALQDSTPSRDRDMLLLEGLYQLALHERTDGPEFRHLGELVLDRLCAAYGEVLSQAA